MDDPTAGKVAIEWVTKTCAAEARILIVAGAGSPQASARERTSRPTTLSSTTKASPLHWLRMKASKPLERNAGVDLPVVEGRKEVRAPQHDEESKCAEEFSLAIRLCDNVLL